MLRDCLNTILRLLLLLPFAVPVEDWAHRSLKAMFTPARLQAPTRSTLLRLEIPG